jgi:hypothetical protein
MPETAEKTESKAKVPRTKAPATYHVLKLVDGQYSHLTLAGPVKAPSRKAAIKEALKTASRASGGAARRSMLWIALVLVSTRSVRRGSSFARVASL